MYLIEYVLPQEVLLFVINLLAEYIQRSFRQTLLILVLKEIPIQISHNFFEGKQKHGEIFPLLHVFSQELLAVCAFGFDTWYKDVNDKVTYLCLIQLENWLSPLRITKSNDNRVTCHECLGRKIVLLSFQVSIEIINDLIDFEAEFWKASVLDERSKIFHLAQNVYLYYSRR